MSVDVSDLLTLAHDLGRAPAEVQRKIVPIMRKTGLMIRKGMQDDLKESTYFKGAGYKMSVDETIDSTGMEIEVYPHHGKKIPSSLYNVAVFGTSRGGGTVNDPVEVLADEAEKAEGHLAKLLEDIL